MSIRTNPPLRCAVLAICRRFDTQRSGSISSPIWDSLTEILHASPADPTSSIVSRYSAVAVCAASFVFTCSPRWFSVCVKPA